MTRCLLRSFLFSGLALVMLLNTASAQDPDSLGYYQYYRADDSFFIKGRLGLNFYGGDRDVNPDNEFQKYTENIGFSFGLEGGYHFSPRLSLSLKHLSGRYPRIEDNRPEPEFPVIDQDNTSKWRHHFSLIARSYMLPEKRVTPYGQLGLNLSFGKINGETRTGIGPVAAFGLDAAVSDRVGIFLELNGIFDFDDAALDLADTQAPAPADASDFDAFTFLGFGVRVNFKSPFVPVMVDCSGPTTLIPNEAGTFAATINEDATRPVEVRWNFGDGATAPGLVATHAFTRPGTYAVTVTASNRRSMDTAECPVEVLAPPACQVTVAPTTLSMCAQPLQAVQFRSTVTGATPITYNWNFGDGNTSSQVNPSHTYTRLDVEPRTETRTATLRVSNAAGSSTCSAQVNIEPCPCADFLDLPCTNFSRNESVLQPAQLQNLRDNLEILRGSPSTMVFIQGYATENERNAAALALDRARAVQQFYIDGGIEASRITIEGTVLEFRPKSGVPCTYTIGYCDEATLNTKRGQIQRQVEQDLRQQ